MKTAETRAKELFRMVNPLHTGRDWMNYAATHPGWLKLGRYVLSLERRLAKSRRIRKGL